MELPDGCLIPVKYWADVSRQVVKWFVENRRVPQPPFKGLEQSGRWFLATSPSHPNGDKMRHYECFESDGGPVFLDMNRSASEFVVCLAAMCNKAGVSPSRITVTLTGWT
jgi:hypothetical protein